jgi:hypothetical protein
MLNWIARRRLAAFERAYDYDLSYLYEMLDASPRALRRFVGIFGISEHREDLPRAAWHAAKLTATLAEDCGPCTQLVVTMAEKDGVAPAVLRGVLADDEAAMGPDAALGWRFARAVLTHDPAIDELRAQLVRRWGRRALISAALAIASARVYPSVKLALGHAQSCVRVRVGGADVQPRSRAPQPAISFGA